MNNNVWNLSHEVDFIIFGFVFEAVFYRNKTLKRVLFFLLDGQCKFSHRTSIFNPLWVDLEYIYT